MSRILFVIPCSSPTWPSGVIRVEQFLEEMRRDGIEPAVRSYRSPLADRLRRTALPSWAKGVGSFAFAVVGRLLDAAHAILTQCDILRAALRHEPVFVQWVALPRWLTRLVTRRTKLVYDFDDATYLARPVRVDLMVRSARVVVAGSHALLDYASPRNQRSVLIPSSVRLSAYTQASASRESNDVPVIGWIGSQWTLPQLEQTNAALRQLASRCEFRLLIAGTGGSVKYRTGLAGVHIQEVERYTSDEIPGLVQQMDIGIMPLFDEPWSRGKCAMKLLLYMAGSRPTVASAVGENRYVVDHGHSGFLVTNEDDWVAALEQLLRDRDLATRMGRRGREIVEERYSANVAYRMLSKEVFEGLRT